MRSVVHKLIFIWDYEKEEKWLNEMAAKGLCLVSVGFCRYEFEECEPGEYKICLQLLDKMPSHPESRKYIEFIESTGAQQVGTFTRWVYFKRKAAQGEFELFSDNRSRIKYLSQIISLLAIITAANLIAGANNLFFAINLASPVNFLGLINLAIGVLGCFGTARLIKKRSVLKKQSQLFE